MSNDVLVNDELFKDKIEEFYYQKVWKENEEYKTQHGKGPYEYNGKFASRTMPYLDSGYHLEKNKWLSDEYGAVWDYQNNSFRFTDGKNAIMFILRWS